MLIRPATENDKALLESVAQAMGTPAGRDDFSRCLMEMAAGRRVIFVAVDDTGPLGYAQLNFTPTYQPFRRLKIAEIQDLNVVPAARRQGIGAALIAICEETARTQGAQEIGISVGLLASFGAAQRLYVRLGYMPDGTGAAYDDEIIHVGDIKPLDDRLTIKLTKSL
jgi:GNAT superfamily N-acetyltransferase